MQVHAVQHRRVIGWRERHRENPNNWATRTSSRSPRRRSRLGLRRDDVPVAGAVLRHGLSEAPDQPAAAGRRRPVVGYSVQFLNGGEFTNQGIELSLQATPVRAAQRFTWVTTMTFYRNYSVVNSLPTAPTFNGRQHSASAPGFLAPGRSVSESSTRTSVGTATALRAGRRLPAGLEHDLRQQFNFKGFRLYGLFEWSRGGSTINLTDLYFDVGPALRRFGQGGQPRGAVRRRPRLRTSGCQLPQGARAHAELYHSEQLVGADPGQPYSRAPGSRSRIQPVDDTGYTGSTRRSASTAIRRSLAARTFSPFPPARSISLASTWGSDMTHSHITARAGVAGRPSRAATLRAAAVARRIGAGGDGGLQGLQRPLFHGTDDGAEYTAGYRQRRDRDDQRKAARLWGFRAHHGRIRTPGGELHQYRAAVHHVQPGRGSDGGVHGATGGVWGFEYTNILQGKQIIATLPKSRRPIPRHRSPVITGLIQTLEAYNYMIVAEIHDTLGLEIQPALGRRRRRPKFASRTAGRTLWRSSTRQTPT